MRETHLGQVINPFQLLDYAGPTEFLPTPERLGVGEFAAPLSGNYRPRDS